MKPLKVMAVAAFSAQLGLAYIAKASASSKGRPTQAEDQMIKMAKEGLERALKS
jgi:hypothetical protein